MHEKDTRKWDEVVADLIASGEMQISDLDGRHVKGIALYVERERARYREVLEQIAGYGELESSITAREALDSR